MGAAGLLCLLAAPILSTSGPRFVLAAAALFRATLLFRSPDLSDDAFRYLWDARVARAGISPWRYAPAAPEVAGLDPALRAKVAHPAIRTVYPPVAEAAFRIGSGGGRSGLALKTLFAAADVGVVWMLCRESPFAGALYALHPLAVTESAGQGHVDALGILLLLISLAALRSGRRTASGIAYAGAVLTKYVPLAGVLPMARRGRLPLVIAAAATTSVLWLAAAREGASPLGGMRDYATRWEFNSVLYPATVRVVHATDLPARAKSAFLDWKARHGHPPWTQSVFPYFYDAFFARAALGVLLAAVLVVIAWRVRDPTAAVFASIASLLLVSPTLHPWYLLWTLPFAAQRREPAFLFLSFSSPLAYGLLYPIPMLSRSFLLLAQYVPFTLLLAATLARALRRRANAAAARA